MEDVKPLIKKSEVSVSEGPEGFIDFLNSHGIKAELVDFDKYGFSRTIGFTVYGVEFRIVWFVNESNLRIGTHERAARIPFKFMYFDNSFPLIGDNKSIGFSYTKMERKSMFDRSYPYEVFRLPIEL